ncbi:hypothetical protein V5799_008883 [Amblyomma americanum]|uniref:Uncharacterized protein n=1 Tax=Amblyomma americanum TaxID=6943 RepID=A0AAQ4FDG9_AMBAM
MKSNIVVAVSFILSIGDVFPGNGHFHIVHACHKLELKLKPGVTPPGKGWHPRIGRFQNLEACPVFNFNCSVQTWGQECFFGGCRCLQMMGSEPSYGCYKYSGDQPPVGFKLPPVTTEYPQIARSPLLPTTPNMDDLDYPPSTEDWRTVDPPIPSRTPSFTTSSSSTEKAPVTTLHTSEKEPSSTTPSPPKNKTFIPNQWKNYFYADAQNKNNPMYHTKK